MVEKERKRQRGGIHTHIEGRGDRNAHRAVIAGKGERHVQVQMLD